MSNRSSRPAVVRMSLVATALVAVAGVAEARPVRGPVARAERRVFRAQMALERELARPLGRVRVVEVAPPLAAQSAVPAPAPAQAGVARTAFEAPLPEPIAKPQPEAAAEPAADGTVSVLVRPESQPAASPPARAAEPLLFPGASQP